MKTRKLRKMGYEERGSNLGMDNGVYNFVSKIAAEISEEVREASRDFPKEKDYLADMVRRQSRLVCINLEEAWKVKEHKDVFIDRLSEAAKAASKTQNCLECASRCNYIDKKFFEKLDAMYEDIFELLCCEADTE
jgi:four helix bundle protein